MTAVNAMMLQPTMILNEILNANKFGDCIGFYLGLSSKSYSLQQDACNKKKVECVPRDVSEGLKPFEIY